MSCDSFVSMRALRLAASFIAGNSVSRFGSMVAGAPTAGQHERAGNSLTLSDRQRHMSNQVKKTEQTYRLARERYARIGVDTDRALRNLGSVSISLHCWQGDDVGGFENMGQELGGGLAVTGNYPGRARTPDELRSDFVKAISLIPGRHRLNLHACYAETGGRKVERDELR